jgi:Ca2+-binding RTX toxin-like protein
MATGAAGKDVLRGTSGIDRHFGLAGDDILEGGAEGDYLDGGTGADVMAGGEGNDLYVVDDAGDQVIEGVDQGRDEVRTTLSGYKLADNVENLRALGTAGLVLFGNGLNNSVMGAAGRIRCTAGTAMTVSAGVMATIACSAARVTTF